MRANLHNNQHTIPVTIQLSLQVSDVHPTLAPTVQITQPTNTTAQHPLPPQAQIPPTTNHTQHTTSIQDTHMIPAIQSTAIQDQEMIDTNVAITSQAVTQISQISTTIVVPQLTFSQQNRSETHSHTIAQQAPGTGQFNIVSTNQLAHTGSASIAIMTETPDLLTTQEEAYRNPEFFQLHGKTPRENALEILRRMEMVRQLTETETQLAVARQTQDTGECSTRVEQQPQMAPTLSQTELLDRMGLLLPSSSTMLAPQPI